MISGSIASPPTRSGRGSKKADIRRPRSSETGSPTIPADPSPRHDLPNDRLAVVAVFDLAARRHEVARALGEALIREISAPRVTEQHDDAAVGQTAEPARDPVGHRPF